MKYALYVLPCSGKTTLFSGLTISTIHGSIELNKLALCAFSMLSDNEKDSIRRQYANQLKAKSDTFISDGHYSFLNNIVFTEADGEVYDIFIYLYCNPEVISRRLKESPKNSRFASLSVEQINRWQNFEIENLRAECHKRNKDFYVVEDITADDLKTFIDRIESGYSSFVIAENIVQRIVRKYPEPCELHICDGDKTIIMQDSFRVCTDEYATHVFDGNFYTGYQSLCFSEEISNSNYVTEKLNNIQLNNMIYGMLFNKNYVILSSGVDELWKHLAEIYKLKYVIADTLISADTKYFVVKLLQNKGYNIIAYGDGKNDLYMLKQANTGYLFIGNRLSRSLLQEKVSEIRLLYDKSPCIVSKFNDNISEEIAICKSNSGINGAKLADAHIKLGKELGKNIRYSIPNIDTAVIVLERGGRFFGDGVYTEFGGIFYSYNPKNDAFPDIHSNIAIIVDSVINKGNSVRQIIDRLKKKIPNIEIFIATNVIQENALETLADYKVFAIRTSANSFIGSRQKEQKNGKGPDTADRLFNYIN